MAGYFQNVLVMGVVKGDVEAQYTSGGTLMAKFTVRHTSSFKDANGEKQFENVYFNMVAWQKQAELVNQMVKDGTQIMVECTYSPNVYVSKDDGKKKVYPQFRVKEFRLIGDKPQGGDEGDGEQPAGDVEPQQDTLPF